MTVSDLNPHIRYARVHDTDICIKPDISKNYDCRFFFLNDIEGSIKINGEKYNIINNTAIYLPPASEYCFSIIPGGRITILNFDLVNSFSLIRESLGTGTVRCFESERVPDYEILKELASPIVRVAAQIAPLLSGCIDNFILKKPFYLESSSALLKLCLISLMGQHDDLSRSELCESVLSYIRQQYSDAALTNGAIAENFSYHPFHLSRLIKRETGKSLHEYLIYYRLQMAKNYLITTKFEISQIAWRCGFNSAAHFTKIFKASSGMTPKEYRRIRIHTEI